MFLPVRRCALQLVIITLMLAGAERQCPGADVVMWHNDRSHTGQNRSETILKPSNVNDRLFGKLYAYPIDGYAYAQPLYLSKLEIPGKGAHNVVFVATEHDSIYAFDADGNVGPQSTLWHVSFIDPAREITPVPCADVRTQDLYPEIGITGTPAIDRASGTLYLVERTKEMRHVREEIPDPATTQRATTAPSTTEPAASRPAVRMITRVRDEPHWIQRLHALDIATGAEKLGGPVVIGDTCQDENGSAIRNRTDIRAPGSGEGTADGFIAFNALTQHQRCALLLDHGKLYVAYASHGDNQPAHGWVLAFGADDLKLKSALCTSPDGSLATTWMAGASLAADAEGNLFCATGNGASDAQKGGRDYGESILRVSSTQPLRVDDFYMPGNFEALNQNDLDLGSGGPLLLPDQPGAHPHQLILAGKEGIIYVLDREHLGGLDANGDHALQILHGLSYLHVTDHHEINVINTPAYFNGNLYYTSRSDPVSQFRVSEGKVIETPLHQAKQQFNFPPPTLSVSSDGDGDGIVWAINNGNRAQLLAYAADDVSDALYDSNALGSRDQFGAGVKFTLPTIADGKVFVGSQEGLVVFGLLPPAKIRPAAPDKLVATAAGAGEIDLTWADNAGDETGYRIERAVESGHFEQINTAGRNTTSYADKSLRAETAYRYRVRATNSAGDSKYSAVVTETTAAAPPDPTLVGHWSFDEGTGPTAGDSTVAANHGTIHGEVVWTHGHVGSGALGFHGAGVAPGYVEVPDGPHLRFSAEQSFTISVWVDPAAVPDKWAGLVTKSADTAPGYGLWGDPHNRWLFGMPGGGDGNAVGGTITMGWHQVVGVQDARARTRTLYVDGVKIATAAAVDGTGKGDLWVGGAKGDERQYVDARIDDVRIYDRPLDGDEIAALATRHNPAPVTALAAEVTHKSQIKLTWKRSAEPAVESAYRIERSTGGANFSQIAKAPAGAGSFVDAGPLTAGAWYAYRVSATNVAGDSPASEISIRFAGPATVPATAPQHEMRDER